MRSWALGAISGDGARSHQGRALADFVVIVPNPLKVASRGLTEIKVAEVIVVNA